MLKITVKNQMLSLSEEVVAENSSEFASFSASFSPEWEGYEKTVRFRHAESQTVYDVANVTDGEKYFIPAEVLHRGRVYISCIGVKGSSSIATATRESFEVKGALISGEGTVPTVTPNAYAQYVSLVKDRADEVNSAAERTLQYATDAEEAKDSALESSIEASKSANTALSAQKRAEKSASSATLSELSAKSSFDMVMDQVLGIEKKCIEKKNELDEYTELKKSHIDEYAERTYLEVADYADELKKDFSADAGVMVTNFDVHYASKMDLLSQKADEHTSSISQYSEDAKKSAAEASDSAFSASVCKNQTLNALSSALQSEQRSLEYAERAAVSSEIAAEKAAEAHNVIAGVFPTKKLYYTKEQADKRFSSAFYSYKKGDCLYLEDSDTDTEFESFRVYGNTVRSHIPSPQNPCSITSFDGSIIFCGENVLDPEKCELFNVTYDGSGVFTAQLGETDSCANISMNSLIPFLRAGETYTLTVKSDIAEENEKTVVTLGNTDFSADAACGFVTFTVPYTWDMSAFYISLSYFERTEDIKERKRTFTCLGLNRGISPAYTPYNGYTLSVDTPLNAVTVYNGKNGNPASKICDTLEYRDGELKLIRRIGKAVLTGNDSETWNYLPAKDQPDTLNFNCRIKGKGNYPVICDRFEYRGINTNTFAEQIASNGHASHVMFQISKEAIGWSQEYTRSQILEAMKEWVSENNITVYYVLETPVETTISTNLIFPDKNIYCGFPGVIFEAEYKSERRKPFPCVISNTVSGKSVELNAAAEGIPFEKIEFTGASFQETTSHDAPKDIESFGSAVIAYKGTNLTNHLVYTAHHAACTNGIIQVTLPEGENHAVLYDETLNYTLEGGKTYNLCVECDREPAAEEKIGIDINGNVFYSEAGALNVTFTVPEGVNENKVSVYLCHFDTPVTEAQKRVYGALRVTEGDTPMPYEQYNGSLIFMKSETETDHGEIDTVLRSCGEVHDKISIFGKTGILEKRIRIVTATGDESISFKKDHADGVTAEFIVHLSDLKKGDVYCSHFNLLSAEDIEKNGLEGVYAAEDGIVIRILTSRLDEYSPDLLNDAKSTIFSDWLWYYSPSFQYVIRQPKLYDISESDFCKSITALRTLGNNGRLTSIFDTGYLTPYFGSVQGDISVTYPCEMAELLSFKIAEAVNA